MNFPVRTAMAALALLLIPAAAASAASISYVAADGNVRLVSPDGSRDVAISTNGTTANPYRSPSQTDSGRIVALRSVSGNGMAFFFNNAGNQTDAWNLPSSGTGLKFAPYNGGQIAPEGNGGTMVYDYFHADGPFNNYYNQVRVGFVAGGGLTNPCTINCHGGFLRPRWIPGTPYAGFINNSFSNISVQSAQGVGTWIQMNDPNAGDIESFDISRAANRLVLEISNDGTPQTGADPSRFEFYGFDGTPPNAQIGFVCGTDLIAPATSYPRYSPDGTMIAWAGADGIYVSPAPVHGPGGICTLQPRRITTGGSQPGWGKGDVPAPPQDPTDPDPTGPTNPTTPTNPTNPTGPTNPTTPTGPGEPTVDTPIVLAPDQAETPAEAVKDGLVVRVACREACKVAATATVNKRTAKRYGLGKKAAAVATGAGQSAAAGVAEVPLEFKAKAARKLKKVRSLKLSVEAQISYSSGSETVKSTLALE